MRFRTVFSALAIAAVGLGATLAAIPAAASDGYEATIRRTSHGIPHITGDTYADVAYGFGIAFAEDNICTAADFYVTVNAERSKWFGPDESWAFRGNGTSNTNRESDFYYAAVNASGRIEELLAQQPPHGPAPEIRDAVLGYVQGYNDYLASVGGADGISDPRCKGQPWVRPITEVDVYRRFYQLASLASTGVAINEIGGAQPPPPGGDGGAPAPDLDRQVELLDQIPGRLSHALGIGSNAYGLGKEVTDNGKGIVLGNPHFPWHGGERLYQFHLTIPGTLNVSGSALYGVPLVLIGHTDGLAWSHTVSTAYRFTPFELTLVPGAPTTYLVDGEPREMEAFPVEIEVLQGDGTVGTESRTLYRTEYGWMATGVLGLPIFPWTPVRAFAIGDANDHLRYLNHFFEKNHAQSVDELLEVITRNQGVPWVNTMAADSTGRTLYSDISVVPNVPDSLAQTCNTEVGAAAFAALGLPVLDGARSSCNWQVDDDAVVPGIFGPGNLPHLFRDDYVHNGNDSYWLSNPNEPLTGFARIIGDEETERTLRTRLGLVMVEDRLAGADEYTGISPDRFTHEIVKDVVNNNRQYAGELTRDGIAQLCANLPGGMALGQSGPVDVSEACSVLAAWDGRDDLDSPGALLFRRFWTYVDDADPAHWLTPFSASDPVRTPNTLNVALPTVQAALADAVSDLEGLGASVDALLRDWQGEDRGDGDFIPIHGGPGSLGVFNAINVGWSSSNGYRNVDHGSSFVMVVQFTDGCPLTSAIVTYSQSEDVTSPWFKDQTKLYSDKGWNDMHFCEEDILADPNLTTVTVSGTAAAAPTTPSAPAPAPDPSDPASPAPAPADDAPTPTGQVSGDGTTAVTGGGLALLGLLSIGGAVSLWQRRP